jgi:hypothetical protein
MEQQTDEVAAQQCVTGCSGPKPAAARLVIVTFPGTHAPWKPQVSG